MVANCGSGLCGSGLGRDLSLHGSGWADCRASFSVAARYRLGENDTRHSPPLTCDHLSFRATPLSTSANAGRPAPPFALRARWGSPAILRSVAVACGRRCARQKQLRVLWERPWPRFLTPRATPPSPAGGWAAARPSTPANRAADHRLPPPAPQGVALMPCWSQVKAGECRGLF